MATIIPAHTLNLLEVEQRFGLQQIYDAAFFTEWQITAAELPTEERWLLDRAQRDFLYLAKGTLHEEIVKLVVLSPLLSVAGFYQRPFRPVAEHQVELALEVGDEKIRGRLDILVLNESLWVVAVESKNSHLSVRAALPQMLFYMLASPPTQSALFGLATNGDEFLLLKLVKEESPQYAMSRPFSLLNLGNELYTVATILAQLGQNVAIAA
ncbi:MAG: type I restriction enzyme HsdR N-terminal domain-containing protein [Spirulina sp. SIO3F2]|nr:type I restriction enzyme HsdR N-terminal domain-containing protein [Spirulina sp. SIO3F2]